MNTTLFFIIFIFICLVLIYFLLKVEEKFEESDDPIHFLGEDTVAIPKDVFSTRYRSLPFSFEVTYSTEKPFGLLYADIHQSDMKDKTVPNCIVLYIIDWHVSLVIINNDKVVIALNVFNASLENCNQKHTISCQNRDKTIYVKVDDNPVQIFPLEKEFITSRGGYQIFLGGVPSNSSGNPMLNADDMFFKGCIYSGKYLFNGVLTDFSSKDFILTGGGAVIEKNCDISPIPSTTFDGSTYGMAERTWSNIGANISYSFTFQTFENDRYCVLIIDQESEDMYAVVYLQDNMLFFEMKINSFKFTDQIGTEKIAAMKSYNIEIDVANDIKTILFVINDIRFSAPFDTKDNQFLNSDQIYVAGFPYNFKLPKSLLVQHQFIGSISNVLVKKQKAIVKKMMQSSKIEHY
jgi:hypothetical protein